MMGCTGAQYSGAVQQEALLCRACSPDLSAKSDRRHNADSRLTQGRLSVVRYSIMTHLTAKMLEEVLVLIFTAIACSESFFLYLANVGGKWQPSSP